MFVLRPTRTGAFPLPKLAGGCHQPCKLALLYKPSIYTLILSFSSRIHMFNLFDEVLDSCEKNTLSLIFPLIKMDADRYAAQAAIADLSLLW